VEKYKRYKQFRLRHGMGYGKASEIVGREIKLDKG